MKKVLYVLSGTILLTGGFFGYTKLTTKTVAHTEYTVISDDLVQRVIVNGRTKAATSVSLGFEVGGKVASTSVKVGSHVNKGDVLARLNNGDYDSQIVKAKATIAADQAVLDSLRKGATFEQVAVKETELANAQAVLSDAEKTVSDKVDDIVNNTIDQLYSNPHTSNPQFNLPLLDSTIKDSLNLERVKIETVLKNWNDNDIDGNLPLIMGFLEDVAAVVNSQTPSTNFSDTTLDKYKTALSSARASIIAAKTALTSARATLSLAEKNLLLIKSGNTPEAIKAQIAKVAQDQATLQSIYVEQEKLVLRSPQAGIVTQQEAKAGQIVTADKPLITIISESGMEVEAYVSEVNIGKVNVGQPVEMSFDAFPRKMYKGTVTYIEPGETIVEGVVNYKIIVALSEEYPELKSGLTTKLNIITQSKANVISVPVFSIIDLNNTTTVLKKVGDKFMQVPVTLGLKSGDGYVEVVSGLSRGDIIDIAPEINSVDCVNGCVK